MFSKTGNPVDSQVNQMLHQGVVDPQLHAANAQLHGVNPQLASGFQNVGGMGHPVGGMGHSVGGMGHPVGGMGHSVGGMVPGDQTLQHSTLGTVTGMVGQGVSTGLGYHTATALPSRDPQLKHGAVAGDGSHKGLGTGKGTITFRPIEARFTHDKDLLGKMDPYCKFKIGLHKGKSMVAKGQGVTPVWEDAVPVKHKNQEFAKLKVKDHDKLKIDGTIGIAKIPLDLVISQGRIDQWIPITKKDKVTGEVHLIIEYTPRTGKVRTHDTNAV